ncbi:MAG: phosphatase domain-containing protein [Bdellovibrionales bacterium]
MAQWQHWRSRADINGDVVFFSYASRTLEKEAQQVFLWDLDKTYLDTSIDSLSGLLQTILEKAMSKKNIPGTDTLLHCLARRYQVPSQEATRFPIYFISASPPQMEERIIEKMGLDEIKPLGCFFKDNLKNLRPGRWWRLTKQVGFKVQALLQLRTRLRDDVRQICWGDDSESDATIYNLYSDICARRLSTNEVRSVLEDLSCTSDQIDQILLLQSQVPPRDPVEKIYINLAKDTDPDYYLKFGRRTMPTMNTFQVAVDLYQFGILGLEDIYEVTENMTTEYDYTPEELMSSFQELIRRGVIQEKSYSQMKPFFVQKGLLHSSFEPSTPLVKEDTIIHDPWIPDRIDYLNDFR